MPREQDYKRFSNLTYEDFRRLAREDGLTDSERVGFPTEYREGREAAIFSDILGKLDNLEQAGKVVLDIGPGCAEPARRMIDFCERQDHTLLLADSPEMLERLPESPNARLFPGVYPEVPDLFERYEGRADAIVCYSVIQYVFSEGNLWRFLDKTLSLLAEQGRLLLGDIPNASMRKRFLSSTAGYEFHVAHMGTTEPPEVRFQQIEADQIDDSVILSLLMRARAAGFHAYVMPQPSELPMANRREDILIVRP